MARPRTWRPEIRMQKLKSFLVIPILITSIYAGSFLSLPCFAKYSEKEEEQNYLQAIADKEKDSGALSSDALNARLNYVVFLKNHGRNTQAENKCRALLIDCEKSEGKDALLTAEIVDQLGRVLRHQGRYAEAEINQRRALAIREKKLTPDSLELADAYVNLAKVLEHLPGQKLEAKDLYLKAIAITEKSKAQREILNAKGNLASCLMDMGETVKARELYLECVKAEQGGKPRPYILATLFCNIGRSYEYTKEYEEAYKYLEQALKIFREVSDRHEYLAVVLRSMGEVNAHRGRYKEASLQLIEAEKFQRSHNSSAMDNALLAERFNLINTLNSVAACLPSTPSEKQLASNIYEETAILKALQKSPNNNAVLELDPVLRKRILLLGKDHPLTAELQLQIGILLQHHNGDDAPLRNSAELIISSFGKDLISKGTKSSARHDALVKTLGTKNDAHNFAYQNLLLLALLHGLHRQPQLAEQDLMLANKCLSQQVLSHAGHSISPPAQIGEKCLTLSSIWLMVGNYRQAHVLAESALASAEKTNIPILKYDALVQQATIALSEADIDLASQFAQAALQFGKSIFEKKSPKLIPCFRVLAQTNLAKGEYAENNRFIASLLENYSLSDDDILFFRNMTGFAYLGAGKFEQAKTYLKMSVDSCDDAVSNQAGDRSMFTAASTALAECYLHEGNVEGALAELDWALSTDRNNEAPAGRVATARDFAGLAHVHILSGAPDLAAREALQAADNTDQFLRNGFDQLSFAQQCSYVNVTRQVRNLLLETCSDAKTLPQAYGYIMKWKGLLLETLRSQSAMTSALSTADSKTKAVVLELAKVRARLSELGASGGAETGVLTSEKEKLERELSTQTQVKQLVDVIATHDVEWFRKLLKPDQAFLDVLTFRASNKDNEHYALVAMKSGPGGQPRLFDLGDKKQIDQQIADWRDNLTQQLPATNRDARDDRDVRLPSKLGKQTSLNSEQYLQLTNNLAQLFITNPKITDFLGSDVKRIWLCPESNMARIPWNSLSTICSSSNSAFEISEVDSPREFAQIALVKNLLNGGSTDKLLLTGISSFHDESFADLPGTEKEIEGIKSEAKQIAMPFEELFNEQATKENVAKKIVDATVVHFSTHGFARGDRRSSESNDSADNSKIQFGLQSVVSAISRNPLTDSGLVLAHPHLQVKIAKGESQVTESKPIKVSSLEASLTRSTETNLSGAKNNLLTAEEIVGLNLRTCKLVSLSACKTGLGTGLNGQGVIGLRSAILAAGARSILMSLWSVDDDATETLMRKFYSYLLDEKNPLNEVEALQKAQDYVRSQPQWQSPNYWAGWVIAGDGWQTIR